MAELLESNVASVALLEHLDILSGCQLSLLLDTLILEILSELMRINIGVILADLAHKCLCVVVCRVQESFLSLENFFLDAFWSVNIEHPW